MKMIMTFKEPACRAKYEMEVGWDGMIWYHTLLTEQEIVNGNKYILVARKWKASWVNK